MSDRAFVGSIPEVYDECLVPMLFRPYALDLADRVAGHLADHPSGSRVLEAAAGTGVVTAALARRLPPSTHIVATDLNQAMLDVAAQRVEAPGVEFQQADLQDLPFPGGSFDAACCQFGMMFVPDKTRAYAELRRVLRAGGTLLFSVWRPIETSPFADEAVAALARCFPSDPPRFISRTPHGYHDEALIDAALRAAGFTSVTIDTVTLPCVAPSARAAAVGYCQGSPLLHELLDRDPGGLARLTDVVTAALLDRFGPDEIRSTMEALIVTAA